MAGPRRFDHDEAVRLHAEGMSQTEIAARFGVTRRAIWFAVKRATDPQWATRNCERHRILQQKRLRSESCAACGKTIWKQPGRQSSGLCHACLGASRATGIRETELQCKRCGEWKPDRAFLSARRNLSRRGHHIYCRSCQTIIRQEYREAHKQPCVHCGAPALPPSENRNPNGEPRCRLCFQAVIGGRLAERLSSLREVAS